MTCIFFLLLIHVVIHSPFFLLPQHAAIHINTLREANKVVDLDEMGALNKTHPLLTASLISLEVQQPLFCIARGPVPDSLPPLDVGRMDVPCPYCNASHWLEESTVSSRSSCPEFEACCAHGKISLPLFSVPPLVFESPVGSGF